MSSLRNGSNIIINDRPYSVLRFNAAAALAVGSNTLVAAVAGKKIRLLSAVMAIDGTAAAAGIVVRSAVGASQISPSSIGPVSAVVVLPFNEHGWAETLAGEALIGFVTGATNTMGGQYVIFE